MKEAYLALSARDTKPATSRWAVALFTSRESIEVLSRTILALVPAIQSSTCVDVVVNRNHTLALQASKLVQGIGVAEGETRLRVWRVITGDKAHAWNQYVYGIWPGAERTFFVDGYVRVHPQALRRLSEALDADEHALAATGIPHCGRSAETLARQMEAEHGIHGNLYLLRGQVLKFLRHQSFTLPLGIYRTDPLLGAVIKFSLDPTRYNWDPMRIHVVREASWDYRPLSSRNPGDWLIQFRRIFRQGRGVFENLAAQRHLDHEHRPLADLPETASELIGQWMTSHPREVWRAIVRRPIASLALHSGGNPKVWSDVHVPPELMAERSLGGERPLRS